MKNKSEAVRESLTHSQVDKEAGKLIKNNIQRKRIKKLTCQQAAIGGTR